MSILAAVRLAPAINYSYYNSQHSLPTDFQINNETILRGWKKLLIIRSRGKPEIRGGAK